MSTDPVTAPRRGFFRRLWHWLDAGRRALLNLLFLAVIVALLFGWLHGGPPKLQDKTVLVLDLRGPLLDQASGSPRDQALQQIKGEPIAQVRLRDVVGVLDAAARDPHISSALLQLDEFDGAGLPNLREVRRALQRFQAAGKKVVAWGSQFDQRQYLLASAADEVYLHPMGMVSITGYGRLRSYWRDAFDRLGVSANVIRVGKYKNFGEPYFANGPSPETIEADAALYGGLWADYTAMVEQARKLPAGTIAATIADLPARLAAAQGSLATLALQSKLVDALKTRDELRALLIERGTSDPDHKSFRQVGFADYLGRLPAPEAGPSVGVIVAQGSISDGDEPPGAIGGRSTAELVRKARQDDQVKALVLRVNSPGGSAFGSELVRRELELARAAGKPVVVSMGDVAASGGYWITLAADEVIADPSTVTGSIGVFGMLPTADGLLAKLPLHTEGAGTTWLSNAYDPRRPLDPRIAELTQTAIARIYRDFTTLAAQARKTTPEKIDAVAQGRVWTGAQARERALVDRTGGFDDALRAAASRAKLTSKADARPGADFKVSWIEREPGRMGQLLKLLGMDALVAGLAAEWSADAGLRDAAGVPAALAAHGMPAQLAGAVPEDLRRDLAWLAQTAQGAARGRAVGSLVHCLCSAP